MRAIAEAVAFSVLAVCATAMYIADKDAVLLWWLLFVWAVFTDWGKEK